MNSSLLPVDELLRPRHLHPRVNTPEDYLRAQRQSILAKRAAFPNLRWQLPWYAVEEVPLKICNSEWQLICPCGNTPLYDPEWQLACCFSCGAIYRQAPPDDWREIEAVMVKRHHIDHRHMLPGQTVEELRQENRDHGEPD
jgi:hypothetical protein